MRSSWLPFVRHAETKPFFFVPNVVTYPLEAVFAMTDGEIAALYKTVARTVAVKIAQRAKDFSAKFPTITISKNT
jgi:hypothetical protein